MAIKDEYEVARLHLLPEEQAAFARAFPGAQQVFMLKPPLMTSFGLHRKIKLVHSARPLFRILRASRRLRGTPFDAFGWSADRRSERGFLDEYLQYVEAAMLLLTSESIGEVLKVVDSANRVHGYAEVRRISMAKVRAEVSEDLSLLHGRSSARQTLRSVS